jgi:hypothetical protein
LKALAKLCDQNTSLSYIKHPDDFNDYSSFGKEIAHLSVESSRHLIVGNNSSVLLQYGILGFDVYLYEKSNFIKSSTVIRFPDIKYRSYGAIKFAYFDHKTSLSFWQSFICATGEECLTKIGRHL